jgi:hypothetical protein
LVEQGAAMIVASTIVPARKSSRAADVRGGGVTRRLAAGQMEIAARGAPWPLCLRASLLHNSNSLFSYWEACTKSGDYANAVHIFYGPLDINDEANRVPIDQRAVVDLNALLTFSALELLDESRKSSAKLFWRGARARQYGKNQDSSVTATRRLKRSSIGSRGTGR